MPQGRLANYSLMEILTSDTFFGNLIEAAAISRGGYESSFGVYGDKRRYTITKPLREDRHQCPVGDGRDDWDGGIVYDRKGYGLYMREGKQRIAAVHFTVPIT